MTELSGTLDGIGLFALLNFLAGLKSRGRLAIIDRELSGTLYFTDGRVVGASFRQRHRSKSRWTPSAWPSVRAASASRDEGGEQPAT